MPIVVRVALSAQPVYMALAVCDKGANEILLRCGADGGQMTAKAFTVALGFILGHTAIEALVGVAQEVLGFTGGSSFGVGGGKGQESGSASGTNK